MPALGLRSPLGKDPHGFLLLSGPRSYSELEAELWKSSALSLWHRMCLLLRVPRTAHLNNDSEPGSHPSPAASVQIPPVHYKRFKGFMQDYRRGSCSRNLPWYHINPRRTSSWLPFLCLGQMISFTTGVSSLGNPIQHFCQQYLIPNVHADADIHTTLLQDQQTLTQISRH